MGLAKARKATKADFKLLSCVHAAEVEHDVTHELLEVMVRGSKGGTPGGGGGKGRLS